MFPVISNRRNLEIIEKSFNKIVETLGIQLTHRQQMQAEAFFSMGGPHIYGGVRSGKSFLLSLILLSILESSVFGGANTVVAPHAASYGPEKENFVLLLEAYYEKIGEPIPYRMHKEGTDYRVGTILFSSPISRRERHSEDIEMPTAEEAEMRLRSMLRPICLGSNETVERLVSEIKCLPSHEGKSVTPSEPSSWEFKSRFPDNDLTGYSTDQLKDYWKQDYSKKENND